MTAPRGATAHTGAGWFGLPADGALRVAGLMIIAIPVLLVAAPLATLVATAASMPLPDLARSLGRLGLPALAVQVALLGVLATAWAFAAGVPLAWLAARTDLPGRRFVRVVAPLTLAVPPYVLALAYMVVLAPGGALHGAVAAAFATTTAHVAWPRAIYGTGGAAFILGLAGAPSVFLLVHGALARANPSLEDAARGLGATPFATFRRVTLPLLRGPLLAGALLTFVYACVDFGVVSLLRARTFTTALFTYLVSGYAPAASATIALLLVALLWAILGAQAGAVRFAAGRAARTGPPPDRAGVPADMRGHHGAAPLRLGAWRWPACAYAALVLTLGAGLPVAVLASLAARLGLGGLLAFWAAQGAHLWHTLSVAGATATIVTTLALALAALRGRTRGPALAIAAAQAGYAVPGTVLGLAVVSLVPRTPSLVDGTSGTIVLAMVILFLAPACQAMMAALDGVPAALVHAARGLGATPVAAFRRVTLPLASPAIVAGWALAFGLTARELAATLLLRPPGYDTLAVRIWVHTTDVGPDARAAAAALLLLIVLGAVWAFTLWITSRRAGGFAPRPVA